MHLGPYELDRWLPPPLVAVARNQLRLHYQPIVSAGHGGITAFEALMRWDDPVQGVLRPDWFAPWLEQRADALAIDAWLLGDACQAAATWPEPVAVNVNVLPARLAHPDFVDHLDAALADAGLAPDRLVLELTERGPLGRDPTTARTLAALARRGVALVIDDFLVHYAALGELAQLDVAAVKLDGAFVAPWNRGERSLLAETVVGLAHQLGVAVVAEGIETPAGEAAAVALGCELLQGHRFSPAVPLAATADLLACRPPGGPGHRFRWRGPRYEAGGA